MAFSNITSQSNAQLANIPLGLLIQIAFSNGIRNQISTDFRDYEMVKRAKVANSLARELRFMFQTSLGAAAIQYTNPGTPSRTFPAAQYVNLQENTAVLKGLDATLELEYEAFDRARKNPEKYGEPLQIELESKMSAAKRRLAADLYGDGTGVLGTVSSVTDLGNGKLDVTLNSAARGHSGLFEYSDLFVIYTAGSVGPVVAPAKIATTCGGVAVAQWRVVGKDRENNKVILQAQSSAGADITTGALATLPAATNAIYRYGQATIPNLASLAGGADYSTATEVIAGLDSLVANDGRVVHGITMSGVTGGTRYNAGGNPLDVKHIQKLMSNVKLAVGQDRYRWKMLTMAPESHATLIESRETDRRFQTVEDNKRGVKYFAYVHGNDVLECTESEFVPQNKIYCLPETKGGEKVIEFHGSDFETVKGQDMSDWHLKVDGGSYRSAMVSYLHATGVLICKHPASIGVIENFTNT